MNKRLLNRSYILILVYFVLDCSFQKTLKEESLFFAENVINSPNIFIKNINVNNGILNYIKVNSNNKNNPVALVFIHGTPGDWTHYARYLVDETLQGCCSLFSVDRPGWGQSKIEVSHNFWGIEDSMARQAESISKLLLQIRSKFDVPQLQKIVLIAHSYGVPIALKLAIQFPELVDGLVLLAGSIDPTLEAPRYYNHLTNTCLGKKIVPTVLQRSNVEMMSKQSEIEKMAPYYSQMSKPMLVMHGSADGLVNPKNLDYVQKMFDSKYVTTRMIPGKGHLIHITEKDDIVKYILDTF